VWQLRVLGVDTALCKRDCTSFDGGDIWLLSRSDQWFREVLREVLREEFRHPSLSLFTLTR
jgi:hypothetical protein